MESITGDIQSKLDMATKISRIAKSIAIRHIKEEKKLREQLKTLKHAANKMIEASGSPNPQDWSDALDELERAVV
jgi:hypothetical protein